MSSRYAGPGEAPDIKLRAFEHWRAAGVATMQVVFRDATHFWWGGPGTEAQRAAQPREHSRV